MRNAVNVEIQSQTGVRTFIRLFPAITGIVAIVGIGTSLYFGRFQAIVPPSPFVVSGSPQTAVWELNSAGDYTFDSATVGIVNGRAEFVRKANWWDTAYRYRSPLPVTAGPTGATTGKTVVFRGSTQPYVSVGVMQSDRDDLRIVYWNGTTNTEIARDYIDIAEVRFKLRADIAPNGTDSGYYLYFANALATAPSVNLADVYEFSQDFASDVFSDVNPWSISSSPPVCQSAPAFVVVGGELRKQKYTPDDCFAWNGNWALDATKDWYVEATIRPIGGQIPVVGSLHLHDSLGSGGYWSGLSDEATDSFFFRNSAGTFTPGAATTVVQGTNYRVTWKYDYTSDSNRVHTGWQDGLQKLTDQDTTTNFEANVAYPGVHSYNPFSGGSIPTEIAWDNFKVWEEIGATVNTPWTLYLEGQYPTAESVTLAAGEGIGYGILTGFSAIGSPSAAANLLFVLSPDDGATWWYFNGTWAQSDGTIAQANNALVLNSVLATFPFQTNGTFRWRAFLFDGATQGATQVTLDSVVASFLANPDDLDGDGYTSVAAGGNDCTDSLTSLYSTVATGCSASASATTINLPLPIADHALVQDDSGVFHLFFQDNAEPWTIQHYTTTNFTSLSLVGTALSRGTGPSDFDRAGMWAPHVIRKDGTYYMFYTGVTGPGSNPAAEQRIGVATSSDLATWTKAPVNNCSGTTGNGCVYTCEANWTAWSRGGQWDRQCRDPMVILDPASGLWKLFATTRLLSDSNQVVTVANSSNLTTWNSEGYIEASHGGIAENPFVTQFNGNHYLFFTNYDSGYIKYSKSSTLTANDTGSTNWAAAISIGETGKNAPEITVINNDTWILSESNYASDPAGADLTLKRFVWSLNGTFSLSNLTALACRVGSDAIHPEAAEVCGDGFDNSCSGQVDNPLICTACIDADGDGYGANSPSACTRPGQDCDDTLSNVYPGATEVCDGADNDCNGQVDESLQCGLPLDCAPLWTCAAWSACQNGQQSRTCTDDHGCGTTTNRPALTQVCPSTDQRACLEDWQCDAWSACADGRQSRTCTDRNTCGTTSTKPTTIQTCGAGGPGAAKESLIAVVPNMGRPPRVRTFTPSGERLGEFLAYSEEFRKKSGAQVAVGDVDGDGKADILTGTPVGWRPLLRLFDQSGQRLHQFHPYDSRSRVGVSVAVGDVDGDGVAEVLTAPAGRAGAIVNVYRYDAKRPWFTGAGSIRVQAKYTGGLSLATADVDGDGQAEVIAATTGKAVPRVYIYDYDVLKKRFLLKRSFLAFSRNHRLGVSVAAGDVDGDGTPEIVASSGPGGSAHVRVFSASGNLKGQFVAAGPKFRDGAYPATLDVDGDGAAEILTASNRRGAPNVFIFKRSPTGAYLRLGSFLAFPKNYNTGLRVAAP